MVYAIFMIANKVRAFGKQMEELMKKRGLSFRQLDYKTGISASYLNKFATGKRKPSIEKMEIIAKGLNVPPEYFDEYRVKKAKECIERNPELANIVLEELRQKEKAKTEGKSQAG